jgi:amidohydrolase
LHSLLRLLKVHFGNSSASVSSGEQVMKSAPRQTRVPALFHQSVIGTLALLLMVLSGTLTSVRTQSLIKKSMPGNAALRDQEFDREVQAMFAKLVEMRRDFHRHPELSNKEERTAQVVAEKLRALGLEVKTGVARHGVIGLLKGSLPGGVVAVRADMDGLPIQEVASREYHSLNKGVMHACGHDIHLTVALGVAELLSKHRDKVAGTVKFIFQPAEEMANDAPEWGAKLMVKEGSLENPRPSAILGLHAVALNTTGVLEAGQLAYQYDAVTANSDIFSIKIRGKMSHGSAPHAGIDTITVAAAAVMQLQTIRSRRTDTQDPIVLTIGTIHGGNRENIIAEEVELRGTVRTYSEAVQDQVIRLMHQTLKGVTEIYGASYALDYQKGYPVTLNNAALVQRLLPTMKRIAGENNVTSPRPGMGGEDFSYFAQKVPGFFFWLGVGNKERGITAGNHTPDFDADEKALAVGVKTMAAMVCDYLDQEAGKVN